MIKVHNQHLKVEKVFEHPIVTSESKIIHVYLHQNHYDYINPLQVFWAVAIIVSFAIWDTKLGKVMYAPIFVNDAIVLENVHQNQKNMIVATVIDDFLMPNV